MNTEGHAQVAEDASLPLLRAFFGGQNLRSLEAMRLGNWLTDVSQAVDPVAYAMAANSGKDVADSIVAAVHNVVDELIEQLSSAVLGTLPPIAQGPVQRVLRRMDDVCGEQIVLLRKRIHAAIEGLLGVPGADERAADLAQFFRSIFFVIGYFKFVHPSTPNAPPRMNYQAFLAVFGALETTQGAQGNRAATDRPGSFTQYYPHEHLDRPERLKPPRRRGEPPIFEPGPQLDGAELHGPPSARLGPRSPRSPQDQPRPDIYSYLRDDIMMTAGLLAEVDRELRGMIDAKSWKALWQAFETGKPPEDLDPKVISKLETSIPWHMAMSKLGHALHQVEDFFAHSNWIELAAQTRGGAYLSRILPPTLPESIRNAVPLPIAQEMLERTRTVYAKRLKRHLTKAKANWKDHPPEHWVITGSFDLQDTLISLAHMTEELWGGDAPDPWQNINELADKTSQYIKQPSTAVEQIQKLVRDIGDFLSVPERAVKDKDNAVARVWQDEIGKNIDRLTTPAVQEKTVAEIARHSPLIAGAPSEVQSAFINAMVIVTKIRGGVSLFESINTLKDFLTSPVAWIRDELHLTWSDPFIFWSSELLYDYVGMNRIGCHSLMAKDHGGEPLYEPNKECATAVHYAIMRALLRPWDEGAKPAIDWLALLEFFLRNPATAKESRFVDQRHDLSINIIHTVVAGEQLDCSDAKYSLTKRYAKTAVGPFNWRTIADANFRTGGMPDSEAQRIINLTLAAKKTGVPVAPPNYAFKPGVKVVIPNQRVRLTRRVLVPNGEEPWFVLVMDKGWKIFKGEDATKGNVTPLDPYKPIRISRDETERQILIAKTMRLNARQNYRPARAA